jgi:hypothetical protein
MLDVARPCQRAEAEGGVRHKLHGAIQLALGEDLARVIAYKQSEVAVSCDRGTARCDIISIAESDRLGHLDYGPSYKLRENLFS